MFVRRGVQQITFVVGTCFMHVRKDQMVPRSRRGGSCARPPPRGRCLVVETGYIPSQCAPPHLAWHSAGETGCIPSLQLHTEPFGVAFLSFHHYSTEFFGRAQDPPLQLHRLFAPIDVPFVAPIDVPFVGTVCCTV